MDLIQQDIIGSASEIKDIEGLKKRLIKETSVGKSINTLQIVSIMICLNRLLRYLQQMSQTKIREEWYQRHTHWCRRC